MSEAATGQASAGRDSCGCPVRDEMTYHQRATCTDPAVAALDWFADEPERSAGVTETQGRAAGGRGTPGQAVYEAWHAAWRRRYPGISETRWDELGGDVQAEWEGIARAAIDAGGWDALAADIESLAPGDGVSVASAILAQVCRAVTARLTGSKPEGEVSVWIDDEGDGDAKVTVAWGSLREAERAARGD